MKDQDSKDKVSELRRRAEVAAEKSLGVSDVSALSPEKIRELIHELQVHQIELEIQNEELRQELEASRDNYSKLYDVAPVGYLTLDHKGGILEANLTVCGLLGRVRAFLIGKPLANLVNEEDANALYLHFRQVLETQSEQTCDVRLAKNDGSHVPVRLDTKVLASQDGSPTVPRTFLTAITSRKRAEEDLYAFESRYRRIFDSVRYGILMVDFDTGKILDVNQFLIDLLGYSHEEFLDKYLWQVSPFKDTALNKDAFVELQQKGYIRHEDLPVETKDGRSIDVEVISTGNQIAGGTFIQCNVRDITDRKRWDESLATERQRLYDILETMPVMVCLLTPDYHVPFANRSFRERFGEANGRHCYDYCFGKKEPCDFCESYNVLKTGKPHHWEVKGPDGSVIDAYDLPFTDTEGSPLILEVDIDVTEQRRSQEALQESQRRYRELFERMTSGVAVYEAVDGGKDFIFKALNSAGEKIEHINRADIIGKRVTEAFSGVKEFGILEVFQRVWRTGEQEYFPPHIYSDERDPGTWRESWVYKLPSGEIVAIYNDITDRKQAEEAQRESEERYRAIFDNAGIGIDLLDRDGRILRVNQSLLDMLGYSEEEFHQLTFLDITHPDDKEISKRKLEALAAGEIDSYTLEKRYVRKDGSILWGNLSTSTVRDANGGHRGAVGVIEDITDRKLAEEALAASEQWYRSLVDRSFDGIFVQQGPKIVYANARLYEMLGYSEGELEGIDHWLIYHPDYQEITRERAKARMRGEEVVSQYEVKLKRKDGSFLDGEIGALGVTVKGETSVQVWVRDVSKRKRLEKVQRRLATAIEQCFGALRIDPPPCSQN